MREAKAEAAADWLFDQHRQRARFAGIEPAPDAPDERFAYAVQDGLLARQTAAYPDRVGGYKIGLTTPRMQRLCNGDRPISGVVFAKTIRSSPADVRCADFVRLGIESELAVRLGGPLPAQGGEIGRADVAEAVCEIACAFELIEDRGADYDTLNWLWLAADNSWNGGLVLGPAVSPSDVANLTGTLEIEGQEVDTGSTRDVLGHPYDAVAWLANHLHARGRSLDAGHWISTGSIANIRFAEPGQRFRFTIEGLPPVELCIQ